VHDTGHVWRPLRTDDIPALTRLEQTCSHADGASHPVGDHGWATKLANAADLSHDSLVTTDPGGELLAFALVTYELRPHEAHAYLEGRVAPALRRRGVGGALIAWSEARACDHLARIAGDRTRIVRVLFHDRGPDAVALYERRGLRWQYAERELRLVLDDAIPRIPLPPKLSIETYQPATAPEFYQVYRDSFGTRTAQLWDFATWHYQVADGANCGDFHPELSYLVRDGGAPVGYLMSQDASAPGCLFVQHLGVVPAFRQRGLAAALLSLTAARAREAGFAASVLTVASDNHAALRLYDKLGYQRISCLSAYRKELP
jgi:ribosomal protein S18 acetylase RimI-like enzyme